MGCCTVFQRTFGLSPLAEGLVGVCQPSRLISRQDRASSPVGASIALVLRMNI